MNFNRYRHRLTHAFTTCLHIQQEKKKVQLYTCGVLIDNVNVLFCSVVIIFNFCCSLVCISLSLSHYNSNEHTNSCAHCQKRTHCFHFLGFSLFHLLGFRFKLELCSVLKCTMGVTGLLPLLREHTTTKPTNLSSLSNTTMAIDSYGWLHKGAFAVADKLARGENTDGFVSFLYRIYHNFLKLIS